MDEFNLMYRILKILQKAMDLEEFDKNSISAEVLGISKPKWSRIIGMLVKNGYVTGIEVWNVPEHNYPRVCISSPEITLQGLEYLEENSMMRRAAAVAKGIKEIVPGLNNPPKMVYCSTLGYGMRYEYVMNIEGKNGKTANVLTAWIRENEDIRLTSAYVTKKKVTE